mmetsp:Transcript_22077/g.59553  ORF Transcript_22077/g.59553 Transcript_22077/m.59553 type:complete len:284 (-) Transcript_22077:142-993(-)
MRCLPPSTSELLVSEAKTILETVRHRRNAHGHEVVLLGKEDEQEALRVICASFNGNANADPEPMFDWVLGPELRGKHDHLLRVEFFHYYMRWVFLACLKFGLIFGVRDVNSRNLLACCGVLPPGRRHITNTSSFLSPSMLSLFMAVGAPPPDVVKKSEFPAFTTERMSALGAAGNAGLKHHAHEVGGREGHWYLYVMATAPEAQGRGCTRTALEAVASFTDASAYPCVLDCGSEKNVRVYSRLGYKVLGQSKLSTDDALTRENDAPEERFMARPVASTTPAQQ